MTYRSLMNRARIYRFITYPSATIALLMAFWAFGSGPSARAAESCVGKVGQTGSFVIDTQSGGMSRTYRLHVPEQYDPSMPTPLVLNFHGFLNNAVGQEEQSGFVDKADAEGFIVVHPQGYWDSWNAGWCCGRAVTDQVDDVAFAREIVAEISSTYCIDPDRVFATGMSNGGFMSHRLGCEASDLFAAIAPSSSAIGIRSCTPPRSVPVIQIHGTMDPIVPYAMGSDSIAYWAEYNGCDETSSVVYQNGDATCVLYDNCDEGADVEFCTVEGMPHEWPAYDTGFGYIDATDTYWDFLIAHPLGG